MGNYTLIKFRMSAFICAVCYIVGITYIAVIAPSYAESISNQFTHLLKHPTSMILWYSILYVAFGLSLIILNKSVAIILPKQNNNVFWTFTLKVGDIWSGFVLATGFMMISAIHFFQGSTSSETDLYVIWQTVYILVQAIGGGIELLGGIWMMMVSIILYRLKLISKFTVLLGIFIGFSGILTIIPILQDLAIVFGVGQIIWFICLALTNNENFKFT